jgi:2,4-dienoyl-CoA reductase-like NADH-dependent reductase (Old Yellow Enzyme family)
VPESQKCVAYDNESELNPITVDIRNSRYFSDSIEAMQTAEPALPLLFSPLALRGITARNRIVISPMCQYRSVAGGPTDWHLVHLGKFAMGGAGIVFGDETAVEERGRKTHHCAGIYDNRHVLQYRRITDFIRSMGAIPAIQLGHSGRKASTHGAMRNWAPLGSDDAKDGFPPWIGVAPSALPVEPGAHTPTAMSRDDIAQVLGAWTEAVKRSLDAGFDICEIHGAHGYLIHQFLSPVTNKRTDAYGGNRAGRMRFALEVAEAVRATWPSDRPVFFRASVVDGRGGEWVMEDTIDLAFKLKERGIDLIDCSSGGIQGSSAFPLIPRVPGYHVSYSARIRRTVEIKTMAVGLITDPHHAEAILHAGDTDLVALAREVLHQSDWAVHAATALGVARPYDLLPPDYAYRLYGRDKSRSNYPAGTPTQIPHSSDNFVPYSWPDLS